MICKRVQKVHIGLACMIIKKVDKFRLQESDKCRHLWITRKSKGRDRFGLHGGKIKGIHRRGFPKSSKNRYMFVL